MIAALSLALACQKTPPDAQPEAPPLQVRVQRGPWEDEDGQHLAVASTLLRTADGVAAGAPIVSAAWLSGQTLRVSTSLNGGHGWYPPTTVLDGVHLGEGGEGRPSLGMGSGRVLAAVAVGEPPRPVLAERRGADWSVTPLSEGAQGGLLAMGMVQGDPVIAWLDTRDGQGGPELYAWMDGQEALLYSDGGDGLCACCRPAVGEVDGMPAIAVRDAEGPLREARLFVWDGAAWQDRGQVTHGGWSPGGCPADGPAFDGGQVLISDARDGVRRIYRGDEALPVGEGWQAVQPRAVGGVPAWLEVREGRSRVVVAGQEALLMERALTLGDPVPLGSGLLLPVQSSGAFALAVRVPEPVPSGAPGGQ